MPLAIRRALPYELALTSACTSTSSGRDPSMQHSTAEPGALAGRSARNSADGFGTPFKPAPRHLEHAQLADGAEPVLHRADDAVRVMLLALEIEHGVDDVLERLRAGETAVLRDMADEERRDVLPFRGEQQLRRRLANLADAAGSGLELQREDGLDRIDDDERRAKAGDLLEDALETGFGEQVERRRVRPRAARRAIESDAPILRRSCRAPSRAVSRNAPPPAAGASTCRCPGSPPISTSDPGTTPPPEHPIELVDAARQALRNDGVDFFVQPRPRRGRQ